MLQSVCPQKRVPTLPVCNGACKVKIVPPGLPDFLARGGVIPMMIKRILQSMRWWRQGAVLLGCAMIALGGCATLDRKGEKTLASAVSAQPPEIVRGALHEVFGRAGYQSPAPKMDPLVFQAPARRAEQVAWRDFGDSELVSRVTITLLENLQGGTKVDLTYQILSRPGTMFEDPKFPLVGARSRFRGMLDEAMSRADEMAASGDWLLDLSDWEDNEGLDVRW